jgi:DNA processing protein
MQLAGNPAPILPRRSWMAFSQRSEPACPGSPHGGHVASENMQFPAELRSLASPPRGLWYLGRLPATGERRFSVVGARAATRAGCDRARDIGRGLAQTGAAVVSGGAFGIDAAAHEGALAEGGATFAVLGCGTDVVYPDRHQELFARIAVSGGLLSEYPPGTPPRRGHFPARNRLIAGLAEAVIVVEAALRSGALITARWASTLGRPLFAVPGSSGTDALLHSGRALLAESAEDLLAVLRGDAARPAKAPQVAGRFAPLLNAIELGSNSPDHLCKRMGMALPSLLAVVAEAELEGLVRRAAGNTYEVIGREH